MQIYSGELVGGPSDGNTVSTTVPRIPVKVSTEMWLDGLSRPSSVVSETGSYYWSERHQNFKWHNESIHFHSKRVLQAA